MEMKQKGAGIIRMQKQVSSLNANKWQPGPLIKEVDSYITQEKINKDIAEN